MESYDERRRHEEERRQGQGRNDDARFSPDWSREDAQPKYSDEPYYSRNRELAERSRRGDYYDPDWPYNRDASNRDVERDPHAGRAPKGYKRGDQQIVEEACQRLERDGEVDASDIEVTAEDGLIRLRGTVHDRRAKRRAEECVESIYGVYDVMNELRVSRQATQGMPTRGQLPGAGSSTAEQIDDDRRPPRH